MVERHVPDVQLILEPVMLNLVQPTANGPHGMPGVSAQQRVAEESKTELEKSCKLLQTEAKNAKGQLLNLEIAIPLNVQWTANGVHGDHGMSVLEHVAEECRQEAEPSLNKKDMEENHVWEIHKKCKDATCKPVQFARTAQGMPDSAHHGRFIAATVSLSKDAAKSPADCAKKFPSILKRPKASFPMTLAID